MTLARTWKPGAAPASPSHELIETPLQMAPSTRSADGPAPMLNTSLNVNSPMRAVPSTALTPPSWPPAPLATIPIGRSP